MNEQQLEYHSSVSYLEQFNLTREPFAVDLDDADSNQDDFFLLDAERAQRLNMLYHMCQNSELLLVVTGVNGSGKTSLLNKFIDMRTDSWRQCVINATKTTNPDQLLIEIGEGFGLPQDSVNFGSGLEMLQKRLTEMKRSELMPILIIDDAHQLPTASLTILLKLSELADADERLLRIVLFGEPTINEMFNAPELQEVKHRITHTLTMPLLNEKQTLDYIQYRLSVAGLQTDSPFNASQLKQIYRQSKGLPGLINQFSQNILLGTVKNSEAGSNFSSKIRTAVTLLIIFGVAAGITWFFNPGVIDSLDNTQADQNSKMETHDLPLLPPSKKLPIPTSEKPLANQSAEFDAISGGAHTLRDPPDEDALTKALSIKEDDNAAEELVVQTAAKPEVVQVEAATIPPLAKEESVSHAVTKPQAIQVEATSTPPPTKDEPAQIVKPVPVVAEKIIPKPVQATSKKDWLSQQDPEHFTLQLMGSRKLDSLTLVQRAHKITAESAIVRTQLKGSDWYILVYKSFPSKQQARDAINTLPKGLQITQPWPRPLKDLKKLK